MTKLASGYWNLFDPTNGYTAIHASVIPLLDNETIARRYFFESSMLIELSLLRAVVRDVLIPAKYGEEASQLSEFRTLLEFPKRLFQGFMRRIWVQYFVRDFGLASVFAVSGMLLLLFGTIFGGWYWRSSALTATPTPTGTVMLAVLPIILGVQLLLQAVVADMKNMPERSLQNEISLWSMGSWNCARIWKARIALVESEADQPVETETWTRQKIA